VGKGTRPILSDQKVDTVFLIGFENISGTTLNPMDGSQRPLSSKEWLDFCVALASQAGKNCYIFHGPDSWNPNEASKRISAKYGRIIWKGKRSADDLDDFFDTITGVTGSGPIVPRPR
jgi:hypothetical protein